MGKVIDTFTFFNEEELLEVRLNILENVVSEFVLVQANLTHSNKPKEFIFDISDPRWSKWKNRIHVLNLDLKNSQTIINQRILGLDRYTWTLENAQRDAIFDVLTTLNLKDDDHILCGDVDEIPDPKIIQQISQTETEERVIALKMKMYYYFFNLAFDDNDKNFNFLYNTRICSYKHLKEVVKSTHQLRVWPLEKCFLVQGGWHFSFLNSPNLIKDKIEAFAHQEFNVPRLTNVENIAYNRKTGKDLFNRTFTFSRQNIDQSWPDYIFNNQQLLQQWIKK